MKKFFIKLIRCVFIQMFCSTMTKGFDEGLNVKKMCFKGSCIPRIIWAHWADSDNLPEDVDEMVDVTRKSLRNYTYCLLNPSNFSKFLNISAFPIGYKNLHLAGKADYIRVCLIHRYGGVYVDSTTYVNSGFEMEWFFSEAINGKAQVTTFSDGRPPRFFSPSFFGAIENSNFMQVFKEEFDRALKINRHQSYYLVFTIVKKITFEHSLRMAVQTLPVERNSQRLIFECRASRDCVKNRLLHDPIARAYPFIKLWRVLRDGKKFHFNEMKYFTETYNSKKNFKRRKKK